MLQKAMIDDLISIVVHTPTSPPVPGLSLWCTIGSEHVGGVGENSSWITSVRVRGKFIEVRELFRGLAPALRIQRFRGYPVDTMGVHYTVWCTQYPNSQYMTLAVTRSPCIVVQQNHVMQGVVSL